MAKKYFVLNLGQAKAIFLKSKFIEIRFLKHNTIRYKLDIIQHKTLEEVNKIYRQFSSFIKEWPH